MTSLFDKNLLQIIIITGNFEAFKKFIDEYPLTIELLNLIEGVTVSEYRNNLINRTKNNYEEKFLPRFNKINDILKYLVMEGYVDEYKFRPNDIIYNNKTYKEISSEYYDYINELIQKRQKYLKQVRNLVSDYVIQDLSNLISNYL